MPNLKASKNEKIIVTASVENGVADIRIVDYIGMDDNTESSIRSIVDGLLGRGVNKASVYINSRGGSVFDATEMANQLERLQEVKVTVGALAASAATYLTSKFFTTASKNSQFMIHKPSMVFSGNTQEVESQLKLLANLTEDYKAVYAAKTGMPPEQIDALWGGGDYWMNADEALAKGFIDEVIVQTISYDTQDVAMLQACGAPVVPVATTTQKDNLKTQISTMEKLELIAALGLPVDATDEQIRAAVTDNRQKAATYEASLQAAAKMKKDRATALVNQAVLDKKLTAAQAPAYIALATDNYEGVVAAFGMTASVPQLSAQLNPAATDPVPEVTAVDPEKAKWGLEDWQEKDPEGLTAMFDKDRPRFEALQAAYAKKK